MSASVSKPSHIPVLKSLHLQGKNTPSWTKALRSKKKKKKGHAPSSLSWSHNTIGIYDREHQTSILADRNNLKPFQWHPRCIFTFFYLNFRLVWRVALMSCFLFPFPKSQEHLKATVCSKVIFVIMFNNKPIHLCLSFK